jgi:16S rRNA (cytosine967-C5)-methyltransferase
MPSPAEIRATAARLLNRIIVRHETTDQVLRDVDADPLLLELLFGSLRHYFSLAGAVAHALREPLRMKDHDLMCLMIVGAYQLHHTRIPPHAVLHETVAATRFLRKPWAKSLVNAVLRNAPAPEQSFEHPPWMIRALEDAYGALAPALLLADNERAPMALRINLRRTTVASYCASLTEQQIPWRKADAHTGPALGWGPETLVLEHPVPAARLPGYREGLVSIQDAGAQFVGVILAAALESRAAEPQERSPLRFLDACAAPGGKLFHLLERFPAIEATALDISSTRMEVLLAEARRLEQGSVRTVVSDATRLDWWDGQRFNQVLIDAPCSGTGTLRRHPDIKHLRQPADITRYAALQAQLLTNLWQTLAPGGTLLYCTCSVLPAENDAVVGRFMASAPDAQLDRFHLTTGQATEFGWQLLPLDTDTDGFYFARLRKEVE